MNVKQSVHELLQHLVTLGHAPQLHHELLEKTWPICRLQNVVYFSTQI